MDICRLLEVLNGIDCCTCPIRLDETLFLYYCISVFLCWGITVLLYFFNCRQSFYSCFDCCVFLDCLSFHSSCIFLARRKRNLRSFCARKTFRKITHNFNSFKYRIEIYHANKTFRKTTYDSNSFKYRIDRIVLCVRRIDNVVSGLFLDRFPSSLESGLVKLTRLFHTKEEYPQL